MASSIFCGVDVGSLTAQAVVLQGGRVLGARSIRVKPSPVDSARAVIGDLFTACDLTREAVTRTVATGYGRQTLEERGLADANISEISCHGTGAHHLLPSVRTIIDIGGQDAKVIRVDEHGGIVDFVMNDKCASGTGRFLELMSRTLGVELEELGELARGARRIEELTSRCSIFCETEVLHALQRGVDRRDLAAGITRAIGERAAALARRLGIEPETTMSGGVAKNAAVRVELERLLNLRLLACPADPQIVGALGAAVLAAQGEPGR
jgi:predicted CoA-substrate-specific enzyme activase